jgi:hypothetical protein
VYASAVQDFEKLHRLRMTLIGAVKALVVARKVRTVCAATINLLPVSVSIVLCMYAHEFGAPEVVPPSLVTVKFENVGHVEP